MKTLFGSLALLVSLSAFAEDPEFGSPAASDYTPERTFYGQPDLQGTWTNATYTQLERPDEVDELVLTPEQARRLVTQRDEFYDCLLYTSPSPRDQRGSRMPSSA